MLPHDVEDVVVAGGVKGLRDEQRKIRSGVVPVDPVGEIQGVEVGRAEVDGRRAHFPQVRHVRQRAAAGICPRWPVPHGAPGVHVHGYRVFGLAGGRHPADVARIVPGHEDLIRVGGLAEDLFPGPGCLGPGRFPRLAELRIQSVLVAGHIIQQLFRHRFRERLVRRRAPVSRVAQQAHLVLHLDHDDAVV